MLAPVHRGVGVLEQALDGVGVVGVEADAEAGLDAERGAVEGDLAAELARAPGVSSATVASRSAPCGSTMPNSSPPSRATVSSVRSDSVSRRPTIRSSSSPAWWPRVSLTSLKWSRSTSTSAPRSPVRPRASDSSADAPEQLAVGQPGQRVVQGLVLVVGGVPAQRPGGPPGDQRQHGVQPDRGRRASRRMVPLGVGLAPWRRSRRRGGTPRGRRRPGRWRSATTGCSTRMAAAENCGRRPRCARRSGRRPRPGTPGRRTGSAPRRLPSSEKDTVPSKLSSRSRTTEPWKIARSVADWSRAALGSAEALGQVGAAERRRDGHLLDDRRLGPALVERVVRPSSW